MGTNEFSTEVTLQGCSMAAIASTICLQKDACWEYWETLQWLSCHHWKGWINFCFTIHAWAYWILCNTCMMQGHNASHASFIFLCINIKIKWLHILTFYKNWILQGYVIYYIYMKNKYSGSFVVHGFQWFNIYTLVVFLCLDFNDLILTHKMIVYAATDWHIFCRIKYSCNRISSWRPWRRT